MRIWSEPGFEELARLVYGRTGLWFHAGVSHAAEVATRRAMERAGVPDIETYLSLLHENGCMFGDLVDELTVGATRFFRDPSRFAFIRDSILPEIRRRRGSEHVLRVWSAGCASGEEAYSLAILFEEAGLGNRVFLLGTDISSAALRRARAAAYGASSFRGVEESLVRRFFHRREYREVLDRRIRERVLFVGSNLAGDGGEEADSLTVGMDLIVCCNVLIYFDDEGVRRVFRRFFDSLDDNGWLVTAACDPPLPRDIGFRQVVTRDCIAYRRLPRKDAEKSCVRRLRRMKQGKEGDRREVAGVSSW